MTGTQIHTQKGNNVNAVGSRQRKRESEPKEDADQSSLDSLP